MQPEAVVGSLPLSPLQRRVIDRLVHQYGQFVDVSRLIDAAYWDDANGGPMTARNCIYNIIKRTRGSLRDTPFEIEGSHSKCGFRLIRRAS